MPWMFFPAGPGRRLRTDMSKENRIEAGETRQGHFNRRDALMLGGVLLLTVAAYAQVLGFPFTGLDDGYYVGPDTPMSHGLSWANVWYAFIHLHFHFYYPLTLLSHMVDAQLWGQWAGGHHATNLILHLLCVVLVYACLRLSTGRVGPSAMVAALFALHPFHVEAVVWIAERKELLCTFFTLFALLAYGAYAHNRSRNRYLLVTLLFVAALLSKPMAVTLPAVFLLVDLWPLERLKPGEEAATGEPGLRGWLLWAWGSLWPLLREKLPWFAISLAFSVLTIVANRAGGGLTSLAALPLPWRIGNAFYAYGQYIARTFAPAGLAIYYPHPGRALPIGTALASGVGLLLLIVLGILWRKKAPYLVAGVLFFVITLLPVIGFLQVGSLQSYADRYTYFSLLGLFVPVVWGIADWAGTRHVRKSGLAALGLVIILALTGACWHQVHTWRNDKTLFGRDLALYPKNNYEAWSIMGSVYLNQGHSAMAEEAFKNALAIAPGLTTARVKLGNLLADQGEFRKAEACFERVIHETHEGDGTAVYGLGRALALEGRVKEAVPLLRRAWKLNPFMAQAPIALASTLRNSGQPRSRSGRVAQSGRRFSQALDGAREPRTYARGAGKYQ